MNVLIFPSHASGEINAPASKSYAHRLLIAAALSDGESVIKNIGINDDITATVSCLENLGATINFDGDTVTVKGIYNKERKKETNLFCNESGSTLRFLIPISLIYSDKTKFTGSERLLERPQNVYEELFKEKGCYLEKKDNCLESGGELKSGVYEMPGDVSSQFITGLLFVLPLLDGDSEIVLTTELQSAPYVDITIDVLKLFGIEIETKSKGWYIKGNQKYKSQNTVCEGDWSNAAFLEAFNLIDGNVDIKGLNPESCQGDKIYREFYAKLSENTSSLDISQCPDLGPVLIACAAMKNGAYITGSKRLKLKESDRGAVMAQELKKFGVNIELGDDYIRIPSSELKAPVDKIQCHNDHRIAMSFALLCSVTGGELDGAQCVNKSYPEFFNDIKKLGINYKITQ